MRRTLASLLCAAALLGAAPLPAQPAPHDGTLDPLWNGGAPLTVSIPDYSVGDISVDGNTPVVVQPDGRILIVGPCKGTYRFSACMARLLPDGTLDYGFGPGRSGAFEFSQFPSWPLRSSWISGLARQSDGRIVVAGAAAADAADDNTVYALVARLAADGTLDSSAPTQPVRFEFEHRGNYARSEIRTIAQQADGRIVAAGYTLAADSGSADFAVARLRADLTFDPAFNGTGMRVVALGNNGYAHALAIQPDGKIVVAGYVATSNGRDAAVLRLNADGTPDAAFGNAGFATFDFGGHHFDDIVNDVVVDGAGRIWLAGSQQAEAGRADTDFLVARLRADGTLDTDFRGTGYRTVSFNVATSSEARKLLLQGDGGIVLVGSIDMYGRGFDFAATRLRPDGRNDTSFASGGQMHGRFASALAVSQARSAAFGGSGIVLAGYAASGMDPNGYTTNGRFGVAMIFLDTIFANGFEP